MFQTDGPKRRFSKRQSEIGGFREYGFNVTVSKWRFRKGDLGTAVSETTVSTKLSQTDGFKTTVLQPRFEYDGCKTTGSKRLFHCFTTIFLRRKVSNDDFNTMVSKTRWFLSDVLKTWVSWRRFQNDGFKTPVLQRRSHDDGFKPTRRLETTNSKRRLKG